MSGSAEDGVLTGRKALITGISGQDGAWLAQFLLGIGYQVVGTSRSCAKSFWRLEELGISDNEGLSLRRLDISEAAMCTQVIAEVQPDEVYNLGGLSFIADSFDDPLGTARSTGMAAWNLLEAVRKVCPSARYFQASSSEMFGLAASSPQDEKAPFMPRGPYGAAKAFAHWGVAAYRGRHGVFAASGILYNHESALRGKNFLTRKVARSVASICLGREQKFELGNLDAERDWGFAPEYVQGMWRVLQSRTPDDFILSTGRLTSVRRFVESAFEAANIPICWEGEGFDERAIDVRTGEVRVTISDEYFRPIEAVSLCGNSSKARLKLGWKARVGVEEICRQMVRAELNRASTPKKEVRRAE